MTDRSSYYGIASIIFAAISIVFLGVYFAVSQMNITPQLFDQWNRTSLAISCLSAPMAILAGILGWKGSPTAKKLSSISLVLVCAPYLILFAQFVYYWVPK